LHLPELEQIFPEEQSEVKEHLQPGCVKVHFPFWQLVEAGQFE
jgi:hypothetical protein